ncbi:MAG: sigma-70 family RNA polymerase sigma factor [Mogibacterium sp.]|nr:sigma-70 family RNA polymerase sigma factor [Bacillota bacterium]MBQ3292474.1 sigma-70 family RNA polymerase sigma factor [Mogibacterium sp.]
MQPMDEIYKSYAMTVYKYLLSMTHDEDLSEELTQETFYQAIRTIDRYDESCRISTWLCGIAKNVLITYRRKNRQHEELSDWDGNAQPDQDEIIRSEERVILIRKIHDLPEPFREVVYLRVFGELSFREIGDVHGKTENWARVTFYRGKEKLRKDAEQK